MKKFNEMSQEITGKFTHWLSVHFPDKATKAANEMISVDFESFSSLLSYRYYDEEKKLFINESSGGFALELSVLCGADEKLIQSLADLLRFKCRDNYDVQFLLWGSDKVGQIIDEAFQPQIALGNIYSALAKISSNYYKKAAQTQFRNKKDLPTTLRDYRVFCFVSKKVSQKIEEEFNEMVDLRDDFKISLKTADMSVVDVSLDHFLSVLYTLINPERGYIYPPRVHYHPHESLNRQLVDPSLEVMVEPEHLIVEKCQETDSQHRTQTIVTNLSVRQLPERFALWQSADNFFNIFRLNQAIRCPFVLSIHLRLVPQEEGKALANRRFLGLDKKAKSAYARFVPKTVDLAKEWEKLRKDLDGDEVRLLKIFYNVLLFSKKGEEKIDESSAISCFRYNGIELFNTKYLQLQSYLATLPFHFSEGLFEDLKRAGRLKTLTSWNAANLLPLVADYKVGKTGVLLPTFRNQLAFFNPFNPSLDIPNYNMAVAATSGAGKSFLIQTLLFYLLSVSGKCYVIDLGQSYRKFCEIIGGVYLDYSSLRLNPFSHLTDIKEVSEQIRDLLSVLASPSGELDEVQEEYLRKAVMMAWESKKNNANMDSIVAALKELNSLNHDRRLHDLMTLLERYTTTGAYPEVFNETSLLAPDAKFIVLELGELQNKPNLLKAVLFALILNIEEQIYQSPRNQPKTVVIDEAWRLLSGDNKAAASFIEKGYRTIRRHHGSFITISQSIEDYLGNKEAEACWNCSDIKIIMRQNTKAFDDFLKKHEKYFTPFEEKLIKNFGEAKGNGFSEFLMKIGNISSFHRLFVDPFSRVMFSSSGPEFEAVQRKQQQGMSYSEAIAQVARENYPEEFFNDEVT